MSSPADREILVDSATLINLCRKHNNQLLSILNEQQKVDVQELIRTTQRIQQILWKCVHDYGSLEGLQIKSVEKVYTQICEYEKKIQQLQRMGTLARIITQARLRSRIDQLSNNICIAVESMEKEIREGAVQQLVVDNRDQFSEILENIDEEYAKNVKDRDRLRKSGNDLKKSIDQERYIKDKETREKIDNALSILTNPLEREVMLRAIPSLKVKPLLSEEEVAFVVSALNDDSPKKIPRCMYARSISTYPVDQKTGIREGDPVCDMFCASIFEGRVIAAVADGCGWGAPAKEAARKASQMFVAYMKRHQHHISKTDDAAVLILRAYAAAHKAIIEGFSEEMLFTAGTTTMMAGILMELAEPQGTNTFAFVTASVGDCKAYCFNQAGKRLHEITKGNRGNLDMRDPGGRLGPHKDGGLPDLRNLTLYCCLCKPGDVIGIVSDGVHDNFGEPL